jgi:hypothetical protein
MFFRGSATESCENIDLPLLMPDTEFFAEILPEYLDFQQLMKSSIHYQWRFRGAIFFILIQSINLYLSVIILVF